MTAMTNDRPRHTKSGLFKKALEPMDFANCDCRVTEWHQFDEKKRNRIWLCNVDNHLFQRHEWMETGQNQNHFDKWIYVGLRPRYTNFFVRNARPATEDEIRAAYEQIHGEGSMLE